MTNLIVLSITLVTNQVNGTWYEPASKEWISNYVAEVAAAKLSTNKSKYFLPDDWSLIYSPYRLCTRTFVERTVKLGTWDGTNIVSIGVIKTDEEINPHNHMHSTFKYYWP